MTMFFSNLNPSYFIDCRVSDTHAHFFFSFTGQDLRPSESRSEQWNQPSNPGLLVLLCYSGSDELIWVLSLGLLC